MLQLNCHFDYYSQDFKVEFNDNEDNADEDDDDEGVDDYPSDWEDMDTNNLSGYIQLGTVPTTNFAPSEKRYGTGRIISFPNWIQVSRPSFIQ